MVLLPGNFEAVPLSGSSVKFKREVDLENSAMAGKSGAAVHRPFPTSTLLKGAVP